MFGNLDDCKLGTTNQNSKKNCKVTKHDTRTKICKTQQNMRWSVSFLVSFSQTVTLKQKESNFNTKYVECSTK